MCRELSHFITPSSSWPATAEEKTAVIDEYRKRMDRIPCRNFDGGDGHCPFGSSCFYAHVYRDGTVESHEVRKTTDAEGNLNIVTGVRLSDFLDTRQGRRAFRNT
jgi:E3 ubiquitin-protein ligase makorin